MILGKSVFQENYSRLVKKKLNHEELLWVELQKRAKKYFESLNPVKTIAAKIHNSFSLKDKRWMKVVVGTFCRTLDFRATS